MTASVQLRVASKRPQLPLSAHWKPLQAAAVRRTITDKQMQAESRYAKEETKPTPETVSATCNMLRGGQDSVSGQVIAR
jgi:hypothetical protein